MNMRKFFLIIILCGILGTTINYAQKYKNIADVRQNAETKNDGAAQFLLGYNYECGKGVPKDKQQAKYWYAKAVQNKAPEITKARLASLYDEDGEYDKAYPLYLSYANNPKNEDKKNTHNWYNRSLFSLGLYKYEGRGTAKDISGAIEYLEKARSNKYYPCLSLLYSCYQKSGDLKKAYIIAQEDYYYNGLPMYLAKHYLFGIECSQNLEKVRELLLESANGKQESTHPDGSISTFDKKYQSVAQLYMGIADYFDKEKAQHYGEAIKWLNLAINSEGASDKTKGEAACLLSRCYRFGRGVRQDITTANELEKKAKNLLSEEEYNNFSKYFQTSY